MCWPRCAELSVGFGQAGPVALCVPGGCCLLLTGRARLLLCCWCCPSCLPAAAREGDVPAWPSLRALTFADLGCPLLGKLCPVLGVTVGHRSPQDVTCPVSTKGEGTPLPSGSAVVQGGDGPDDSALAADSWAGGGVKTSPWLWKAACVGRCCCCSILDICGFSLRALLCRLSSGKLLFPL